HLHAEVCRRGELPPKELAAQAGNGCACSALALEIRPPETRIDDRKVGHPGPFGFSEVFLPVTRGSVLLILHLHDVADIPRADYVEPANRLGPFSVLLSPPLPLTAADEHDPVFRIILEEVDHTIGEARAES